MKPWIKANNGQLEYDTKHPAFQKWFKETVLKLSTRIRRFVK